MMAEYSEILACGFYSYLRTSFIARDHHKSSLKIQFVTVAVSRDKCELTKCLSQITLSK